MNEISHTATDREIAKAELYKELKRVTLVMAGSVGTIWGVALLNNLLLAGSLLDLGILPRTLVGLRGILFAPFLHVDMAHLLGNTAGLLMLGSMVIFREERDFWVVTILGILVGGIGTWLVGRPVIHVGASGVIFAYFGYLLTVGIVERKPGAIMLSVLSFLAWGGLLYGVLPTDAGISWEGHLFGLIGGMMAAWWLAQVRKGRRAI
jgi:membrane associated rhomboid family serine protease